MLEKYLPLNNDSVVVIKVETVPVKLSGRDCWMNSFPFDVNLRTSAFDSLSFPV